MLLEGNSAVCRSLLCSPPWRANNSGEAQGLAELGPLQELGGVMQNEEQSFQFSVENTSRAARSQHRGFSCCTLSYTEICPWTSGMQRSPDFCTKKTTLELYLQLYQWSCFNVDALETFPPFLYSFPELEDQKYTNFAEDVSANSLKAIHTHYIATLLNTGPEAIFFFRSSV